jgi:dephospho-CoA kinase
VTRPHLGDNDPRGLFPSSHRPSHRPVANRSHRPKVRHNDGIAVGPERLHRRRAARIGVAGCYRAPVIVVGLTGGIGSGKSTVAALLAARGAVVIDADQIARQVAAPGGAAYDALVGHFGAAVVGAGGVLDRAAIAARVFSDPAELAVLNAVTHPAIAAEMARRLAEEAAGPDRDRVVVLDIALFVEAMRGGYGLAGVIVVDTPVDVAIRRIVEHRGISETDARARAGSQAGREDRRRLADMVIDNDGSRADLVAKIGPLWEWISALGESPSPGTK